MSDMIELSDAELGLVAGGQLLLQLNISTIVQTAVATNTGGVSARGGNAIGIGATASNTALVGQENLVSFRRG